MACRKMCSPSRFMYWTMPRMFSTNNSTSTPPQMNPPGLSQKVVSVPATEVGPGASKNSDYKNPEYFCYSNTSYFEAEVEMKKYRLKQPTNKTPLQK